jgi:hypothetical protein
VNELETTKEQQTDEPTQQELRAQQLVNYATFVRGLSDAAAKALRYVDNTLNVSVNSEPDPVAMILRWVKAATDLDVPLKRWLLDDYAGIRLEFGILHVDVYAKKDVVCPRPTSDVPRRWPEQLAGLELVTHREEM